MAHDRTHTLTQRQREIADMVAAGLTNQQIAERLDITISSVKSHVSYVLRKLGAMRREEVSALLEPNGDKRPAGFSGDDLVEILWAIHALALRSGRPEMARTINRALLRIRLGRNGE